MAAMMWGERVVDDLGQRVRPLVDVGDVAAGAGDVATARPAVVGVGGDHGIVR
jgi:hypothetical protein